MDNQPLQHLAIIPDGNRRWAKKHAVAAPSRIYDKGTDKTFEIIEAAFKLDIPYLTIWASSFSNLQNRAKGAVIALENMYEKKFRELAEHPLIHDKKVRIEILGEWRQLLKPVAIDAAQTAIDATKHYSERLLTILVGYDGHHERGAAVQALLAAAEKSPTELDAAERLLRQHAWTGHLPDVDLIIRTGAWEDPHNSANFLGFLSGESQLAFPPVLWPDFSAGMLADIIANFTDRERRMGR